MRESTNKSGENSSPQSDQQIQSVARAFKILEHLRELDRAGVTKLSKHAGITKSSAHIYLKTLHDLGYLEKKDGQYIVGLRFLHLGGYARKHMKLYEVAKSEVENLSDETDELVSLGIENNRKRMVIYRAEGSQAVYDQTPTGELAPMHMSGLGKAILAHLPDDRISEIIQTHGLEQATENTIKDEAELHEELATIRKQGYAIGDEEMETGQWSVATPIEPEEVVGAIGIAGPKKRLATDFDEDGLISMLEETKNIIELRYRNS